MEGFKDKNNRSSEIIILVIMLMSTILLLTEMAINLSGEVDIWRQPSATLSLPTATYTPGPRPTHPPDYTPEVITDS